MTLELTEIVKPTPFAHMKKSAIVRPIAAKKAEDDEEKKKDPEDDKEDKKDSKKKVEDNDGDQSKAEDKPEDDDKDSKKGKKKVKAEDDDDDGDEDEPKKKDDKKDARAAERTRIKAIMTAGAANPEQAEYLAYETNMSAEQALNILKFSKAPEASKDSLASKMETVPESIFFPGEPKAGLELSMNPTVRLVQEANERRHGKTL